ncbi:class C beta-lactamase [uncultured Pluralibacter sp.]|uniref:class C beta-lactamase n=1 Tax=uncultured Pluralibacter sp. TaxID=1490864 RepID=UPI00261098C2|nr:class C beta-lactamase [uncultured Pluralibacter sp.]
MMPIHFRRCLSGAALIALSCLPASALALSPQALEARVNNVIAPLMKQQQIPGMAVAVIYRGRTQYFYYGLADLQARRPVSGDTLFELGSLSKTFTGIAGGYAAANSEIRLDAPVAEVAPELKMAPWRNISLLQLATYTAGGLPLQLPDDVTSESALLRYYQHWKPEYAPGSVRQYSNASIGLFGALAVKNSGLSFDQYMQRRVLTPLKLAHTFISVPAREEKNYAWGYRDGKPVRVSPGMLDAEAYGIKTTIGDMATFVQANIDGGKLNSGDPLLAKAIVTAQTGYYKTGDMYQGLGWEAWPMPVAADKLIAASDNAVALKPAPAVRQTPARPFGPNSLLHKTGSTNGFGAYAAFIPGHQAGVIMLANKNYPNPQRVAAAWQILRHLD